jgi:Mn-dependent DtxR family transcriptional regulator
MKYMPKKQKTSPAKMAKGLLQTQSAVSQCMINLHRKGLLKREPCICGRGFVYWK